MTDSLLLTVFDPLVPAAVSFLKLTDFSVTHLTSADAIVLGLRVDQDAFS